jgi:hypothetical protein
VPGNDCDDTSGAINPGVEEVCDDGVDNDCDLMVDEENPGELLEEIFNPIADTYVAANSANSNYGTDSELKVKETPKTSYLRFNVTGLSGNVLSSRLRLTVTNSSNSGGTIHSVSDNSWDENLMTFNNRPVVDGL